MFYVVNLNLQPHNSVLPVTKLLTLNMTLPTVIRQICGNSSNIYIANRYVTWHEYLHHFSRVLSTRASERDLNTFKKVYTLLFLSLSLSRYLSYLSLSLSLSLSLAISHISLSLYLSLCLSLSLISLPPSLSLSLTISNISLSISLSLSYILQSFCIP